MSFSIATMEELSVKAPELGNKIKNLASLSQAGFRVPRGFGLPYTTFTSCVHQTLPILERIIDQENDLKIMSSRLRRTIEEISFPYSKHVFAGIEKNLPGTKYFAVRSSGEPVVNSKKIAEDSENISLAGQYESFLMVPAKQVPQAILNCYASLFSERSLRRFHVDEDSSYIRSRMSVLVQEMFAADYSAVVMTQDPIEGEDCLGIESTYGACEAIVSGEVQGDLHLLNRSSGSIISTEIGSKNFFISHNALDTWNKNNMNKSEVTGEMKRRLALPHSIVSKIFDLSMKIEKHFDSPQDIEIVVSNGEVIITQSRPITT